MSNDSVPADTPVGRTQRSVQPADQPQMMSQRPNLPQRLAPPAHFERLPCRVPSTPGIMAALQRRNFTSRAGFGQTHKPLYSSANPGSRQGL